MPAKSFPEVSGLAGKSHAWTGNNVLWDLPVRKNTDCIRRKEARYGDREMVGQGVENEPNLVKVFLGVHFRSFETALFRGSAKEASWVGEVIMGLCGLFPSERLSRSPQLLSVSCLADAGCTPHPLSLSAVLLPNFCWLGSPTPAQQRHGEEGQ